MDFPRTLREVSTRARPGRLQRHRNLLTHIQEKIVGNETKDPRLALTCHPKKKEDSSTAETLHHLTPSLCACVVVEAVHDTPVA